MLANKIKINISPVKPVKLIYGEEEILVKPYLTKEEQVQITNDYLTIYFRQSPDFPMAESNYLEAEFVLMLGVIDACTNIQLFNDDGEPVIMINDFLSNFDLWELVCDKIKNYKDFISKLRAIVLDIKNDISSEKSVGFVLDKIYTGAEALFEKLTSMEINEESVNMVKDMLSEINKSPILSRVNSDVLSDKSKPSAEKKKKTKRKKNVSS